jgi:hypothetical protein
MTAAFCVPYLSCGDSSVAGSAVRDLAGGVINAFVSALTDGATWMVGHDAELIMRPAQLVASAGQVRLEPHGWFYGEYRTMLQLVVLVVFPLLLGATIGAVLRQDLRRLGRVWGIGLPVALLAGLLGTQLTQLALSATDALCQAVMASDGLRVRGSLVSLAKGIVTPGLPSLVAGTISLLLMVGAVLLWMEMVLRTAAIYIAAFFMPLALACYVWPATAGIAKRTLELLTALILSKFVIVATLTLGLAAADTTAGPDSPVIGGAILLLAGFAPFCILRLAPVIETAAVGHLEGMSRRPSRAAGRMARTAAAVPGNPVIMRLLAMSGERRAESRPPDLTAVVAQRIPDRPTDFRTSSAPPAPGGIGTKASPLPSTGSGSPPPSRPSAGVGPARVTGPRPAPATPGHGRGAAGGGHG